MNNNKYNYVVVDIETTGFEPPKASIIEIVALRYFYWHKRDGLFPHPKRRVVFNNLVKPTEGKTYIPDVIQKLTKITPKMVGEKSSVAESMYRFEQRLDIVGNFMNITHQSEDILIAHNAIFERKFFDYYQVGDDLNKIKYICTGALYLAYKYGNTYCARNKGIKWKLEYACKEFGFEYDKEKAHRAEYDVVKTSEIAGALIHYWGVEKCLEISKAHMDYGGWAGEKKQLELFGKGENETTWNFQKIKQR